MKNSIVNVQERRNKILSNLNANDTTTVKKLAEELAVSEITIRRDLKVLSEMGKVDWHHGVVTSNGIELDQGNSLRERIEQLKDSIAAAVPSYIEDNSTLFVNSSSLCWRAINQLAVEPLTIITNNIRATECVRHPQTSIILTGGEIRYPKESLVGTVTIQLLETMQSDYTLIGCDGINIENGVTTQNIYETQVNSTMIQRTKRKVICVADYRKIGVSSNYHVANLSAVDILITDNFANESVIRDFRHRGITVIQVSK
ncbi:DeoR/GlpR family DNA-binding transcription regulator [Lactiplantibacillus pentosus]|uniref:DeoR/GlpR transcriptional regulator n=1 Tax=Lactiplantibacillus pentosus TaxID=1589 RepID=A0AB37RH93_LACPE|nr:DeoR/GlpR family DNA-binding transcription regulator [Lactiplantibacillus pentosus]RMW42383.1 DeoR/GlpR transcriptional regulator [Lactiplantibacillus pentosus]RMW48447.1 DeoR/GlpR transcriptional regulator [Lactiplantibacillus pentosus]RMW52584.1 DeoR/GlpR transcriptional regulator [Lactiplantibacillus pentosus]RMW55318.1 DeoR/GlpR transcriptional regulator [Lactiplantibacillus pentosus]